MDNFLIIEITVDATRWLVRHKTKHLFKTNNSGAKQTLNLTRNPDIV